MGFQNGLSGLNAAAQNLDVIGHNVANVNTVGAKVSRARFADVYATSIYGPGTGIGVQVAGTDQQFSQGALASSDNPLDMAINGNGFFRVTKDGTAYYSRNGEFRRDSENYLSTGDGARLTGYAADADGRILRGGVPVELRLDTGSIAPKVTTEAEMEINLDSRTTVPTLPFSSANPDTYSGATTLRVFDQQGNPYQLTTYFQKTADNAWTVHGSVDGTDLAAPIANLTFNPDGSLLTPAGTTAVSLTGVPAAVGGPLNFDLDLTQLTQYGSAFSITSQTQDGYAPGEVSGYSISQDGTILAKYTNSQTKALGQIVMANFSNPQGLSPLGGNLWAESIESGQPVIGSPGSGSLGSLKAGALESSNIDLTEELVNMIVAQRTYQANAQTIKTQDQVLQTIVNLR